VTAGKRIVGGFFLLMMGLGVILDTPWEVVGVMGAAAGGALVLWGVAAQR
jgi:hypothetical protein